MRGETAVLRTIPLWWKQQLARLVRLPGFDIIMQVGIRLLIPRQRIGVSVVIFDEKQQVLLLRHVFHPHIPWGLPGGWLNRHEDPAVGALRELYEEIGLTADLGPVLQVTHDPHPPHLTIAYMAHLHPGEMILSPEILEAKWFPLGSLPPLFSFMTLAIETAVHLQATNQPIYSTHFKPHRRLLAEEANPHE